MALNGDGDGKGDGDKEERDTEDAKEESSASETGEHAESATSNSGFSFSAGIESFSSIPGVFNMVGGTGDVEEDIGIGIGETETDAVADTPQSIGEKGFTKFGVRLVIGENKGARAAAAAAAAGEGGGRIKQADPKSPSLTAPLSNIMLSGLTSRWTMPRSWQ